MTYTERRWAIASWERAAVPTTLRQTRGAVDPVCEYPLLGTDQLPRH
jgi:hypothetical protein